MNQTQKISLAVLITLGSVFALQGIAQNVKLNPIKPGTKSTAQISDEQQAILAVRMAKASVVSIVGLDNSAAKSNPPSGNLPEIKVSGTGFILDAGGIIITNNHVVEDAALDYSVVMADGTQYPATIYGRDKFDDLAMLKIGAKNLPAVKLGDSDALETGQAVFAIGNSLGRYESTVTRGVVSGLGRAVDEKGDGSSPIMHNWIQTDAAINPGNSGGPLINLSGEVVGINTLIDTSGQSLGFAIPINSAKEAFQQLSSFGNVSRPFLGVQFNTIDSGLQSAMKLSVNQGAIVLGMLPGGVAAASGLKVKDIITQVNNQVLDVRHTLDQIIQKHKAGEQITLKILRDGKNLDIVLVLGQQK